MLRHEHAVVDAVSRPTQKPRARRGVLVQTRIRVVQLFFRSRELLDELVPPTQQRVVLLLTRSARLARQRLALLAVLETLDQTLGRDVRDDGDELANRGVRLGLLRAQRPAGHRRDERPRESARKAGKRSFASAFAVSFFLRELFVHLRQTFDEGFLARRHSLVLGAHRHESHSSLPELRLVRLAAFVNRRDRARQHRASLRLLVRRGVRPRALRLNRGRDVFLIPLHELEFASDPRDARLGGRRGGDGGLARRRQASVRVGSPRLRGRVALAETQDHVSERRRAQTLLLGVALGVGDASPELLKLQIRLRVGAVRASRYRFAEERAASPAKSVFIAHLQVLLRVPFGEVRDQLPQLNRFQIRRSLERVILLRHATHGILEKSQLGDRDARIRRGRFAPSFQSRLLRRERLRQTTFPLELGFQTFFVQTLVPGAPGGLGGMRRAVRRRPGRGRLARHVRRRHEDPPARHRSVLRVLAEPDRRRVRDVRASRNVGVGAVAFDLRFEHFRAFRVAAARSA